LSRHVPARPFGEQYGAQATVFYLARGAPETIAVGGVDFSAGGECVFQLRRFRSARRRFRIGAADRGAVERIAKAPAQANTGAAKLLRGVTQSDLCDLFWRIRKEQEAHKTGLWLGA
jgi:hypothetical protein